jgi:hypothetical protein
MTQLLFQSSRLARPTAHVTLRGANLYANEVVVNLVTCRISRDVVTCSVAEYLKARRHASNLVSTTGQYSHERYIICITTIVLGCGIYVRLYLFIDARIM